MIVGEDQPDSGDLQVGETVRISYVDQGASAGPAKTCGSWCPTDSITSK